MSDEVIALYERRAAAYDELRDRSLMERAWLDRFLELVGPAAPERAILDLGCGMGEPIARHLIERGYAVTGVDSSASMIDRCRRRFPAQTWRVADMRELTFDRFAGFAGFAGIVAWDSLFHLSRDDQRRFIERVADFAAPGAALMFTSGSEDGEAIGEFCGEPLFHASLDVAEYRRRLVDAGFIVRENIITDRSCGDHTVWLAERRGA